MRATRAYVAGFGTSGSLLAGAAALFLLGSAIVALNGWPQIGAGPATSDVGAAPVAVASREARRLTVALAVSHRHVVARRLAAGSARGSVAGAHRSARSGGAAPLGSATPGTGTSVTTVAGGRAVGAGPCTGCGGRGSSSNPIGTLTTTFTRTVSRVGSAVGQQITGVSNTVAGHTGGSLGSTVGSLGSAAGSAVTGTSTSAANAIGGSGGH